MKKDIRKHILSIVFVSTFLIIMTAFVYLPSSENMASALAFLNGQQSFYMEDISNGLSLKDALPTRDSKGLEMEPYTFRVVNKSNKNKKYQIIFKNNYEKANLNGMEVLDNKYLRYVLSDSDDTNLEVNTLPEDGIIATFTALPNSMQTFNFRMWLDYNADNGAMGKMFVGTIELREIK